MPKIEIQSERWGTVIVDDEAIIEIQSGLINYPHATRWVLLETDAENCFKWFQSCDDPELGYVVTDPQYWEPSFNATIRREELEAIGVNNLEEAIVLVTVNRPDIYGGKIITADYQAPLVLGTKSFKGIQLVLTDKLWTTQHHIAEYPNESTARSA